MQPFNCLLHSDDICVIDTALDASYGYHGPVYVWNPGDQFPGQSDVVWKSEDEFSDDEEEEEVSHDEPRDIPKRVPPIIDHNAAIDMLQ